MSLLDLIQVPTPDESERRVRRALVSSRWALRRVLRGLSLRALEILASRPADSRRLPEDTRMVERELRRKRKA